MGEWISKYDYESTNIVNQPSSYPESSFSLLYFLLSELTKEKKQSPLLASPHYVSCTLLAFHRVLKRYLLEIISSIRAIENIRASATKLDNTGKAEPDLFDTVIQEEKIIDQAEYIEKLFSDQLGQKDIYSSPWTYHYGQKSFRFIADNIRDLRNAINNSRSSSSPLSTEEVGKIDHLQKYLRDNFLFLVDISIFSLDNFFE